VRPHLPEEELHEWLDGQLSRKQNAEIAQHLLGCLICRALEAEVRAVRSRTAALLALAAPRRRAEPVRVPSRLRRRVRGAVAAAAAVAVVGSTWMVSRQPASSLGGPTLATALVAPAILARVVAPFTGDSLRDTPLRPATSRARTLTLAQRAATMSPRMMQPRSTGAIPVASRRLRVADPLLDVGPAGDGWETTSLQEAREAAAGAIAHLEGIPVNAVRLQPSEVGGRPTAMVRQLLPDGRAVWVVEGAVEELDQVSRVLQASGLTLASPRRARPDYVGTERTTRMVTVASYLPADSLDALLGARLRLDE
jgi:hypothetical protein